MSTSRQLFLKHIGQTSPAPMMLEIVRAEGVFLYGSKGEKYVDLISGVSVSNTGHRHPAVVKAVKEQADAYLHLMVYGEYIQTPQVKLAEKLCSLLPSHLNSCYFVNSGSEAVEGALKLAKKHTGRSCIISFANSYHGSSHGALSIQGSEKYKNGFRPLLPDVHIVPFNSSEAIGVISNNTACVIIEPVQGEAGVIYPDKGFLESIRMRCSESGTLLIFDEVQTGFGRLGAMFAIDKFGVSPDIIVLAKALGGGLPLGAFISSGEIMSALASDPPLGHITTFGGHPLCCAAGLASLEVLIGEELVKGVQHKSDLFKRSLSHQAVKEIRGDGLLLAVVMDSPEKAAYVVTHAPDYGLILDYFLFCDDAFRIAPPLTITEDEIRYSCKQLGSLLDDMIKKVRT